MVRVATIAESRPEQADAETVRAVQEELNRQGYGPVETDGVMRRPTRAAIMAFEQDHRLGLTGEASQDLLKQMVFGTPQSVGAARLSEVRSPHAEAIVKHVQQALLARGYRPGAADGRLTAETVAALRTFETDQGLVPRGRISAEVLERLETGVAVGGRHPAP
jgi:peptidoglycan hydrolase-like protein with peptidoglycan-binding domain